LIVLIDTSEVREGKLDELKARMQELADFVEASGSGAVFYNFYLSADGRQMTVVQAHPDSESAESQMTAAAPIFARFAHLLEMTAIDVYGEPSASLLQILRRKADTLGLGHPPAVHSLHAGFSRLPAGPRP
jgi:hypothetical protein